MSPNVPPTKKYNINMIICNIKRNIVRVIWLWSKETQIVRFLSLCTNSTWHLFPTMLEIQKKCAFPFLEFFFTSLVPQKRIVSSKQSSVQIINNSGSSQEIVHLLVLAFISLCFFSFSLKARNLFYNVPIDYCAALFYSNKWVTFFMIRIILY